MILLGDQPRLTLEQLSAVTDAAPVPGKPIVVPRYADGRPGNPVLLEREAWPLAAQVDGDRGMSQLFATHPELIHYVEARGTNPGIDTRADAARLQQVGVTEPMKGAVVLRPGEGRAIDLGNFAMSVKASADMTGGAFTLLEATEPAGFGPPIHVHRNAAEAFYVLEGAYAITVEEARFDCPAGSFIFIPPGLKHGFRVGSTPSRKLNLYTPAAMIGYFDELRVALETGEADPDRLAEIALRYGMEVIGPIPDGYL